VIAAETVATATRTDSLIVLGLSFCKEPDWFMLTDKGPGVNQQLLAPPQRGGLTPRAPLRWRPQICRRSRPLSRAFNAVGSPHVRRFHPRDARVRDWSGSALRVMEDLGSRVQPHHQVGTRQRHYPVVAERSDGRWVVKCPECRRSRDSVPIGIDTPVSTVHMAELLRDNHAGTHAIRNASRSLIRN
jgi:hypothetical protein